MFIFPIRHMELKNLKPSLLSNPLLKPVFSLISRIGLFILGWKTRGEMPDLKKFVIVAAPHSSNWDFVIFLLIIFKFQIPVHWMGKNTMFIPPFRTLLQYMGGIPIDRSRKGNTVTIMARAFNDADRLIVTIAPSGTRSRTTTWKTGFYRIADQAKVPIVLGFVDYKRKIGGVGPVFYPTGDMDADLIRIQAFYRGKSGKT